MRRTLAFLLSLILGFPLWAAAVTNTDYVVSKAAVTDCVLAVTAGYIANPRYAMPGCTLVGEPLPHTLTLDESDLGKYLTNIPSEIGTNSWNEKLKARMRGPLDETARTYFTVHDWKEGDVRINGTLTAHWPNGASVKRLVAQALLGMFPKVEIDIEVTLQGKRISRPVEVMGKAVVEKDGFSTDTLDFHYKSL